GLVAADAEPGPQLGVDRMAEGFLAFARDRAADPLDEGDDREQPGGQDGADADEVTLTGKPLPEQQDDPEGHEWQGEDDPGVGEHGPRLSLHEIDLGEIDRVAI